MDKNLLKNQLQESFSIKAMCKAKIKSVFLELRQNNPNIPYYLLVLDEVSLRIVSSSLKMMELMETSITAIEKLELKRKRFPETNAIYLITPTSKSIDLLIEDFQISSSPQYAKVHVFFTNRVPKDLMKKIAENQDLLNRIKTFKEIYLDFLSVEDNIFNLDLPDAIPRLFSGSTDLQKDIYSDMVACKLGTLLISFEKFYEFEVIYSSKNEIAGKTAKNLQAFLSFQLQQMEKSNNTRVDSNSGKVIVLLFDRAIDPLTPLVHDFFYQSMSYDLLNIKNDLMEYEEEDKTGKKTNRKAFLTDNDALFKKYRYKHIAEVLEGIPGEFQEFINKNTTAKLQQGIINTLDLQKLSETIKTMPQYNELLSKYSMHMKIIEQIWKIYEEKELKELGELEQTLATGLTREGISAKETKLIASLNNFLLSSSLSNEDKVRLLLIAILTTEISEKDRAKMLEAIPLEEKTAIPKLAWFGFKHEKKEKKTKKIKEEIKKIAKNKLSSSTLELCRYTPKLETIVEELLENYKKNRPLTDIHCHELQSFVINERLGTGLAGPGPKSLKNKKLAMKIGGFEDENSLVSCTKIVVFGLGGLAYNEIRCVMDFANNQIEDIVFCLGGTNLLKPHDFIESLKGMSSLF